MARDLAADMDLEFDREVTASVCVVLYVTLFSARQRPPLTPKNEERSANRLCAFIVVK